MQRTLPRLRGAALGVWRPRRAQLSTTPPRALHSSGRRAAAVSPPSPGASLRGHRLLPPLSCAAPSSSSSPSSSPGCASATLFSRRTFFFGGSDPTPGLSAFQQEALEAQVARGMRRWRARADAVLWAVELPSRYAVEMTRHALKAGLVLLLEGASLVVALYRGCLHERLRRLIRFLIGVPFFFGTVFLVCMNLWFWTPPKPPGSVMLDTSCARGLPLCDTVEELLLVSLQLRARYHEMLEEQRTGDARTQAAAASQRLLVGATALPAAAQNEVLREVYVLLRSMEQCLMDTPLERDLIEPSLRFSMAGGSKITNVSPAEFTLRVVLAIALEQGWADVIESCRKLFRVLVRNHPVPQQANVVQYVAGLCQLSYELRSGGSMTWQQRRQVARAIDGFRPEKAVSERYTIPSEVTSVPIADSDLATRCVVVTRHSPGRKPQLILCFIGSTSLQNWVTNFWFFRRPLPACYGVGGDVAVHSGFLQLLESVPYTDVAAPYDQILLVGHSLGGALAQLAGLRLAAERPSRRITVVTMASPRVLAHGETWRQTLRRQLPSPGRWARRRAAELAAAAAALVTGPPATAAAAADAPAAAVVGVGDDGAGDPLGEITLPSNFMHLRGYINADAVPHLPPEFFLHFTHIGRPIPLETGCRSFTSFVLWGMWSYLFHSADMYRRVLEEPVVSQTHVYRAPDPDEDEDEDEDEDMALLSSVAQAAAGPFAPSNSETANMMMPFRF